jgi:hypothetical protein
MRASILPCLAGLLACLASLPAAAQERRPGCARGTVEDAVREVGEDGVLALASGRLLRLADIRLAEGEAGAQALGRLRALAGNPVRVAAEPAPDRWGRQAGEVAGAGGDVAAGLLDAGLALVDVGGAMALCRPGLYAREEEARRRRVGTWAMPGERPLWAGDAPEVLARKGRFTLIEGRVRSVGERRWRTYLNFGTDWSQDTTVAVPRRVWDALVRQGWSAAGLRGRRVRARGIVEDWRGPSIEIATAEMIEIWDVDRWRR